MAKRPGSAPLLSRSLMQAAARLHYLDGLSQVEVSRRIQVSTATVSRLLSLARKEGIVRIEIADPDAAGDLGPGLAGALGIGAVRVLDSDRVATLAAQVGALLLDAGLPPGAAIVVGWGRTVQGVIEAGLPRLAAPVLVPSTGGMTETASHFQIGEFVRRAADQTGGTARFLHAPSIVSPELRAGLARDTGAARVLALWGRAEAAILGIGEYGPETGPAAIVFDPGARARVAGDVARHYFDEAGREIRWQGQDRLMGIARPDLVRIPLAIGVAQGRAKARAIVGAARSGMVSALVLDRPAAEAVLERLAGRDGA